MADPYVISSPPTEYGIADDIYDYDSGTGAVTMDGCSMCSSPPDDLTMVEVQSATSASFSHYVFPSPRTDNAVVPLVLNVPAPDFRLTIGFGAPYSASGSNTVSVNGNQLLLYHDGLLVGDITLATTALKLLRIEGTSRDDTIDLTGLTLPTTRAEIDTGAGNDSITLGSGPSAASIDAGSGADAVNARASSAPVDADLGSGDDTYNGSHSSDEVRGGYGEDVINGYEARDRLYGGPNDDTLRLGDGANESAYGEGGADVLTSGNGSTKESWADLLVGGSGNDTLTGGSGANELWGQQGNDRMYGNGGSDNLWDPYGANTFAGGPGNDDIMAGTTSAARDDHINCGRGSKDATRYRYRSHRYCELYKNWTDPDGPFWYHY